MTPGAACTACRAIRRFLLSFALGIVVAWQLNGAPPLGLPGEAWQGVTTVLLMFAMVSVALRVRQMRRRWTR